MRHKFGRTVNKVGGRRFKGTIEFKCGTGLDPRINLNLIVPTYYKGYNQKANNIGKNIYHKIIEVLEKEGFWIKEIGNKNQDSLGCNK